MSNNDNNRPKLVAERRYSDAPPPKTPAPKKPASRKAAKPKVRRGPIGWLIAMVVGLVRFVLMFILRLMWRGAAVLTAILAVGVFYFSSQMPPITEVIDGRARGSVTMTDNENEVFAWRGDQFGGMVTTDTVSVHLKNAVVASEDKRFYGHFGLSPRGIASAIRINLREGRGPLSGNGGSTITQQVGKLLCLGVPFDPNTWETERAYEDDCRRTTLWRKIKEAVFAMGMEVAYTKDEILTIYLNRAYLGAGSRGFEAASQRYFGKSSAQLTPAESAMLSSLLPAPTSRAPTRDLKRAQEYANIVIGLMEDQGYLSASAAAEARANPATLSTAAERRAGGYFADWVMASGPEFFTRNTTEDVIIHTTIDQRIQSAAEDALTYIFSEKVSDDSKAEAAIVVMSADGAVRAMVGGRDSTVAGAFNRATQARRQTGSAFKPFVYATALELGMQPNDMVNDVPTCWFIRGSGDWCPANYDKEFKGPVTLTHALRESRNIPAVVLAEQMGREIVRNVATAFGIESDLAAGPALALGASESTLIEMTGAYAGILNGGSAVTPYGLIDLRFQGDTEPLMDSAGTGIGERVIQEKAARELTWMMSRVVEEGTGGRAKIDGWEIAGKTGTTSAARDAWFIGFTGEYVTGVWMGYDDNSPLKGVTGGGLPADIWRETMTRVLDGRTPVPLPMDAPTATATSAPVMTGGTTNQPQDQTILNVLDTIFGGGN
ncbi:MAG: transglycosylase domain-containing protein [Yoonia sp.]|nr:transglycosylase domain-containing protein [Yoonia sp.]